MLSCNIITTDLSDHLATHTRITLGCSTIIETRKNTNDTHKNFDIRIFNEANNETFKQLINDESWDEITDNMDAQSAFNKLEEIYTKHYNTAFPLKSNRVRRKNERQDPKPWILPWLEDACARKQDAYHKFVKTPTPENKAKYEKLNIFCKNISIWPRPNTESLISKNIRTILASSGK